MHRVNLVVSTDCCFNMADTYTEGKLARWSGWGSGSAARGGSCSNARRTPAEETRRSPMSTFVFCEGDYQDLLAERANAAPVPNNFGHNSGIMPAPVGFQHRLNASIIYPLSRRNRPALVTVPARARFGTVFSIIPCAG